MSKYIHPREGLQAVALAEDIIAMGPLREGIDGLMWSYSAGVWLPDKYVIRNRVVESLGERHRRSYLTNVEDVVRERSPKIECDPVPEYLNLRNGVYAWDADQLYEHRPEILSTVQFPINWNPTAKCPAFDEFQSQVVPADMIKIVWDFIGYLLYSGNPLHKAVMLLGTGRNGKGPSCAPCGHCLAVGATSPRCHCMTSPAIYLPPLPCLARSPTSPVTLTGNIWSRPQSSRRSPATTPSPPNTRVVIGSTSLPGRCRCFPQAKCRLRRMSRPATCRVGW